MSLTKRDLILIAFICFACFFFRLGSVGLFDFNEGFYAQVAREMQLRGDWITPRVNGLFFFDKPPLAIWLSAISIRLLGASPFAVRLPVALAATALVYATAFFGARYFGRRTGLLAGIFIALNPLFFGTARQMTMDIHQSLWFAVAMFSFYRGYRGEKRWYWGFWAACGLAYLAKSIPGLFALPCVLIFVIINERYNTRAIMLRIWEAMPVPGIFLLFAVIAPWHYLAWSANGRVFYEEYWLLHHVKLATGGDFSHKQPLWYYIPMFATGFFPWSFMLPAVPAIHLEDSQQKETFRFCLIWAITLVVIFTLMTSKLMSYLLPMYPAAALLSGLAVSRAMDKTCSLLEGRIIKGAIIAAGFILIAALVAGLIAASGLSPDKIEELSPGLLMYARHALWLLALGGVTSAGLAIMQFQRRAIIMLIITMTAFIFLTVTEGFQKYQSSQNAPLQTMARHAGKMQENGIPLAIHIGRPRRPSVLFYLPDSAFVKKPLSKKVGDREIVLERGEIEPIESFIKLQPLSLILTDYKRAGNLKHDGFQTNVIEAAGPWRLLLATRSSEPIR